MGAVLFDLDGVLVDSSRPVRRHWSALAARLGLDVDEILDSAHGRPSRETIARLVPDATAAADHLSWFEQVEARDNDDVVALRGAHELIDGLPSDRWAVVTSGGDAVARVRLAAAGFEVPDVFVTADDVVAGKPDPEGYRKAAELLGADSRVVVFEDAPPGVTAGRAAGFIVVGVATTYPPAALDSDHVVASLADVTVRTTTPLDLDLRTVG